MNENKLEKFRASLKVRMGAVVCYNAAVLVCIALGLFHLAGGGADNGFIVGFNLGLCVGVQVVGLIYLGRCRAALSNGEKLKSLYVAETDERNLFIKEKMGGRAVNLIVCGLVLATVAAGYFNRTVFFALLGASLFAVAVKGGMKIYYRNKY